MIEHIEVLEQHANSLEGGRHDVIDGEIIRFPTFASEGSDCTTHGIQVRANGLFVSLESGNIVFHAQGTQYVPESGIFTFAYRIRISMDASVPATQAAQLVSRHWEIIDESNGSMEVVDGEGVIGQFPTMKPGAYFEYVSKTRQATPRYTMRGALTFRLLDGSGNVEVTIAPFPLHYQ